MKTIILLTILFVMISCSKKPLVGDWLYQTIPGEEKLLNAKEISINIFWEYNYLQMISRSIYAVRNVNKSSIINSIKAYKDMQKSKYNPGFCNSTEILVGERIFLSKEDSRYIDAECLYENQNFTLERIMKMAYDRDFFFERHNDYIRVIYKGDSLSIKSGTIYGHKKKDENVFVKNSKTNEITPINGKKYEFFISLLSPVSTLTMEIPLCRLRGYSPLKLDPSLLPLESPGYKALREQEEAMNKE